MEPTKLLEELNQRFPKGLFEEMLIVRETLDTERKKYLDTQIKLVALEKKLDEWEMQELKKITEEVDSDGKKRFSNDLLRKSELENRKKNNQINSLFGEQQETEWVLKEQNNKVISLDNYFQVLITMGQFVSRRG